MDSDELTAGKHGHVTTVSLLSPLSSASSTPYTTAAILGIFLAGVLLAGFMGRATKCKLGLTPTEYAFPDEKSHPLDDMTVPELKEICRELSLSPTRVKSVLLERLKEFSGNPGKWNVTKPGARRAHKGPRNGSQAASKHLSQQRRLAQFGCGDAVQGQNLEDLKHNDPRTQQEIHDLLQFCARYVTEHPEIQAPRPKKSAVTESANKVIDARALSKQLDGLSNRLDAFMLGNQGPPVHSLPSSQPPSSSHIQLSSVPSLAHPLAATTPSVPCPPAALPNTLAASSSSLPPSAPMSARTSLITSDASDPMKTLTIASGLTLNYRLSEVQDPRSISYAKDIERLARQWSDDHPHFKSDDCEVTIQGHGIALKYWPDVFGVKPKGSCDRRWSSMKATHNEWKWVASEYLRHDSGEDFWAKFQNDKKPDKRMSYTEIVRALCEIRKASDAGED
ncbi:hypothetical protein PM082_015852 [Marasmius tenuissimus]|nr:hypothetical protein PM082_015852 [Marasmius tenuissimus]